MNSRDRYIVFGVGFFIGLIIVSILLSWRAAQEAVAVDPWMSGDREGLDSGVLSIPDSVHESIRKGQIIRFGTLPVDAKPTERVWLLNFEKSYPYVRVVESIEDGSLTYMAADQVLIKLKADVDVTQLKPMLDSLELRLRMFNRKEHIAVVGVVSTEIDAVPETLNALLPHSDLFEEATADFIKFQPTGETSE